jgi:heptaprenyl diphosphate synthase
MGGVSVADPLLRLPEGTNDLQRIDTALRDSVQTADAFLTEVASHLVVAGGKRLRPLFAGAAGSIATPEAPATDDVIMGGVAVELVQVGSLYHDDVMDEADTRRAVESVNHRWGNLTAILAGDFLLAKASEIAAGLGTEVAGLLAATIGRLCEGQVRELQDVFNVERTEEHYYQSIEGKTAALFSCATRIGAIVADLPRDQIDLLTTYGHRFGMAFQIVDDVLDIVATDEQLGKPAGHDAEEGVYTLPVIRTLAGDRGAELGDLLGGPIEGENLETVKRIVRTGTGVDEALAEAERFSREAVEALAPLPQSQITKALAETAEEVVSDVRAVWAAA